MVHVVYHVLRRSAQFLQSLGMFVFEAGAALEKDGKLLDIGNHR
jgi:hypothetical protein